jgi:DNA topoisomerase-1
MPRRKKIKIDQIFDDSKWGSVIEPVQKAPAGEIEKIEKMGDIEKIEKIKRERMASEVQKPEADRETHEEEESAQTPSGGYTLVICEKPQAAMKIAYSLADFSPTKKNFIGVPYWELECQGKKMVIASAVGHLFGLVEKEKTQSWPVFELEWKAGESFVRRYVSALQHLAKNASDFIVACDYDIEGELIGFNALRFICHRDDARRMKFSTLTKPDLLASYDNIMEHVDFGQAYAGETRHYLDYYYGISLSRALMQAIRSAGAFKVLSIGRVQGPSLGLVAKREHEIQAFKSESYWQIFLTVIDNQGIEVELKYQKDLFNEEEAKGFEQLRGKSGEAITTKEEKNIWPFPPFDLTSLQMEAYKFFGLNPAQTLAVAQKLYLSGLISYPRTSSQKLPPVIGYKRILDKINQNYPKLAEQVTRSFPVQGKKTDPAHPAIFPTGEHSAKLSQTERQVYELILKRFIACFSKDALIEEKKITAKINEYEFSTSGKRILERGWLDVYPMRLEERELLDINGKVLVKEVKLEQKETQPPRRYNSASLVSELEKKNLGTKATRANVVDTLYKRGYITGRLIEVTKLGNSVALTLEKNCPMILDEQLTRKFEEEMDKIQQEPEKEKMIADEKNILKEARETLMQISKQFKSKEKEIGRELLSAHEEIQEQEKKANTLCQCPICKEGMLIMLRSRRGKRFMGCERYPGCKASFPLPQFGLIKVAGKQCECGFPMLMLIRKGKPPWTFCINTECYVKKEKLKVREEKLKIREEKAKEKLKLKRARVRKRQAKLRKAAKKKKEREEKKASKGVSPSA